MGEYVNLNKCRSFNQAIAASLLPLEDQICSEVIIVNKTTEPILVFDGGYSNAQNGFLLESLESATFRGITNTNQVSAISTAAGTGDIYYRTQYFSNTPSR
mgnify:CR=1 FL=1|tara:strand:- start:221 stop:523 length:303 start_codon:yes stop_codon:yes gene_type:complete